MADLESNLSPTPRWMVDLILTAAAATTTTGRSLRAKAWKVLMFLACLGPKGSYPGDDAAGLALGMASSSVIRPIPALEVQGNRDGG